MTTKRWMVALCTTAIFAGMTFAQTPAGPAPAVPLPITEGLLPSALLPLDNPIPGSDGRYWVRGEYLFSWIHGNRLPSLVTTSVPGTGREAAGVLGANGTQTLFEGSVGDTMRPGFRLEAGWMFDPERKFGVEAGMMLLGSQTTLFSASSANGFAILARPFNNNGNKNSQAASLIAFPGASTGSVDVSARSGNFYEGHLDITERALDYGWSRLIAMIGYRMFRYDENLRIQSVTNPFEVPFVPGTRITGIDEFTTRNEFHGLDMGLRSQFFWQDFSLDVITKVAVGRLNREINIAGAQVISVPGAAIVNQAGNLYALTSNIGDRKNGDWKAFPEIGANLGWQLRPYLRARLGYSALLMNSVARAGDQIDTVINPNYLPPANPALGGPPRPIFSMNTSNVWIQNINIGLEFSY